ncbi:MAG: hypothetical protein AAGA48_22980 [Myxococcota bacterium]
MSSESATAPTPFHIWVAPYERGGRHIRGHWRPRSGQADEARAWMEANGKSVILDPFERDLLERELQENPGRKDDERDMPRPLPQRISQLPPQMGQSLASDEPPIGEILAQLGVDRSEGRRWRRAGKHPALRWSRRYEHADENELAGV